MCGEGVECGWTGKAACPALAQVANSKAGSICVSDGDCASGHYCDLRVDNRMFCDNAPPVYAKDYCPDAGAEAGTDGGSDAKSDAAPDAGP